MAYEPGNYLCEIVGQGFGEIPNDNKTPFFFLEVKPLGRINPSNPTGDLFTCEAYLRTANLYLTDKSVESTLARLRSLGWNGTSFKDIEPNGLHSFAGIEIELVCTSRTSGDKTYDDFNFPFEGNSSAESDPDVARKMDNMFGKALKSTLPVAKKSNQEAVQQIKDAMDNPPQTATTEPVTAAAGDGSEDSDSIPF